MDPIELPEFEFSPPLPTTVNFGTAEENNVELYLHDEDYQDMVDGSGYLVELPTGMSTI